MWERRHPLSIWFWNRLKLLLCWYYLFWFWDLVYVLFSCFLLVPVCSIAFLLTYESLGKRKYMKGLFWISAVSFVLAQVLQIFEIAYYIELVTLVHILLGVIILGVLISYLDKKRKKEKIADSSIYSAMLILAVFCIFDIIRYYVSPTAKVGDFSKVGIMLFFVYLGMCAIRQVGRLQIQEAENRMYQKLAYTDMMTGMSFALSVEEIQKSILLKCVKDL